MSPKKMGRPTDNPKPFRLAVRLDVDTKLVLDSYCEQEKISPTEAVRRGIKQLEKYLHKK